MTAPAPANPVSLESFSARLEALGAPPRFAMAVSGGRDSMALMRLAGAYVQKTKTHVTALIVDHGLRPEAAEEARKAAGWCRTAGVEAKVLSWRGEKPSAGVQAAARAARYKLLIEAATDAKCDALLTAHTADDQAETLFMRLARGAGVRGLSAMYEEIKVAAGAGEPLRLLRPLLSFSRAEMTATVEHYKQDFIDDPSNEDPAYERVRVRALLAALEENSFLSGEALAQTAARLRGAEDRLRRQEEDLFRTLGGCFYRWGGASLDRIEEREGLAGLSARLVFAVSGEDFPPDETAALAALRQASASGAATIGGALMKSWKGRLWFVREPGAVLGRTGVAPLAPVALDGPLLWDGRFIIRPGANHRNLTVTPLGALPPGDDKKPFYGPSEGLAAAPAILCENALIGAPALPFMPVNGIAAQSLTPERFSGGIIRF